MNQPAFQRLPQEPLSHRERGRGEGFFSLPLSFLAAFVTIVFALHSARAAGPEVKSLLPSGGQRGATVAVTASGNFPKWPVQAWVDRPGVTVTAAADKGKLSAAVAADAAPGVYWIRLHDADAAAAVRPFIVGTLAEVVEQEPNNTPATAQTVGTSTVVNGRLGSAGDADLFAVPLAKGQTLVAALEAHETLGSPFDGVLQIVGPRGNVVAYNHDQRGLDPEIAFVAPADGAYRVRVFGFPATPNSTIAFAGSDAYVYRLTLTIGPFVDYPWPLAVTRGRETRVELIGWNLPEPLKSIVVRSDGDSADIVDPQLANAVRVAVEPHETIVEVEPNALPSPQPIGLPVTVTGRIESPGDVDAFAFAGKKGEAVEFQLESRVLGYPLDGVLELTDASGKSFARVDDVGAARDAVLAFTPPADGQYRIAVSDLNRQGSSRHVYRLRGAVPQPDYEVTVDAESYVLPVGKPAEITLSIVRRNGFAEPIVFKATGLPDFVTTAAAESTPTGGASKTVKLVLNAASGAFSGPFRILAESGGPSKLARTATIPLPTRSARIADVWLTVK